LRLGRGECGEQHSYSRGREYCFFDHR
jgi:hypothetical protein